VSALSYLDAADILLVVLTSEETDNAYDDGMIGDSYFAWVTEATTKLQGDQIRISGMMNLSDVDDIFKNQKIEGICSEPLSNDRWVFHLVSDNDVGETRIFKISTPRSGLK
jgi:hypothetical protein